MKSLANQIIYIFFKIKIKINSFKINYSYFCTEKIFQVVYYWIELFYIESLKYRMDIAYKALLLRITKYRNLLIELIICQNNVNIELLVYRSSYITCSFKFNN